MRDIQKQIPAAEEIIAQHPGDYGSQLQALLAGIISLNMKMGRKEVKPCNFCKDLHLEEQVGITMCLYDGLCRLYKTQREGIEQRTH